MLKALWFAVKVGLLIAVAVWVAEQPGEVRIAWGEYVITAQMGAFLLVILAAILLSIFIYQFIKAVVTFPASMRRYNEIKRREKGYRALTRGLSAVAAGDRKAAVLQAKKAASFMPDDHGLPMLLQAQAARLDGRTEDAAKSFVALLESEDASFLGVRGLLQNALDVGDYNTAQRLAAKALALYPKQKWILQIAFDLALKVRDWDEASAVLKRGEKVGAFDKDKARGDRAAIMLARVEDCFTQGYDDAAFEGLKKARRMAPEFVPATLKFLEFYQGKDDVKAARKLIERTWKSHPHEAYVALWRDLMPLKDADDSLAALKHMARLVQINDSLALAHCAAARAAMDAGIWGEARDYLRAAEEIEPSAGLYRLWAEFEQRSGADEDAVRAWLEKAVDAPSDKMWVCGESGQIYERWRVMSGVDGAAFNALEWRAAFAGDKALALAGKTMMVDAMIEAPAA